MDGLMLAAITNSEFWVGLFSGFPMWFGAGFVACMGCMSITSQFWEKRSK
jgi:hypothetical protein